MADPVEAGADVALKDPLGRRPLAEQEEASFDGVGGGSPWSKAVGALVPHGLGDGTEREQVECLHGSILHGRDAQGSHFARLLGDIHPPQRLRLVASLPQAAYGGYLLTRCGPGFPVHTGRSLATICRHSFDGKSFAAIRVCQQALQGLHLVPPAFMCRLHDTRLEAAHSSFGPAPVDLVPVLGLVGGCTRVVPGTPGGPTQRLGLRHLLFLLSCLIKLSRGGTPRGSLLTFVPGMLPVSDPLQAGFCLLRDELPASLSAYLTARFPHRGGIRAYHVPCLYLDGLGPACTPVTLRLRQDRNEGPAPGHIPFGSSLLPCGHSNLWLVKRDGASDGNLLTLAIPSTRPPSRLVLAATASPHGSAAHTQRATLSRRLRTLRLPRTHAPVGSGGRTPGQFLMYPPT
jgi:hypothetical protein